MEVEIIGFFPKKSGNNLGSVDVKVIYTPEKNEIFRNMSVWVSKMGKMNVSFGSIKRGEEWLPRYERNPYPKELFGVILLKLNEYMENYPSVFDEE